MKYCPLCGKEYTEGETCDKDGAVLVRMQPGNELLIGQVLGGSYRIVEQIGEGGMAMVFRGVQIPLQRDVAIKVLLPSLNSTPSMIQRFFQEAQLLCQMSHPNVVRIIDFGNTETGLVYMVMEFLRGTTLREKVPVSGLPMAETLNLMRQICAGVGSAHRCGLIHRDLKPDNIFIATVPGEPEQVKILDFGIARAADGDPLETRLTRTGLVMGTPGFLAPEQIGGAADADARSDIYALGAILYLIATGSRPYEGGTPNSILVQQLQEPPNLDLGRLGGRGLLADVVRKAMHRTPEERYQSTDELITALEAAAGRPDPVTAEAAELDQTVATLMMRKGVDASSRPAGQGSSPARRFVLPSVAVLAILGTVFVGTVFWTLSQSRGSSDQNSTGKTEAVRGVSGDRVLVGMSAAFSGSAKELGRGMRLGIEICFSEVNDHGGIHGRGLELIALDDGYEPSRAVANMADLLLKRGAFAILGNVGTPTAEVAVPLALEQEAPFFGAFTGADVLRRQPPDRFVFNYRASYSEETAALVEYLLDARGLEPSEIVVFAQEDGFGDAGYRGVTSTLEKRGHAERVPRLGYRRNRIEVDGAVDTLLRAHPNAKGLVLVATYRAAAELIRQLEDRDADLIFASLSFVGSRALAEELQEMGPEYSDGVIVSQVVPHYDSEEPGVVRYRQSLAAHAPSEQPGFVSLEGYLACRTFAEGLERAGGDLTVDSFIAAVESMSNLDLEIGSEIHFRPDRHQGSSRVWGTVLDSSASYQILDLRPPTH